MRRLLSVLRTRLAKLVYPEAPTDRQWLRIVMNRDVTAWLDGLPADQIDVVEVSGALRGDRPWKSYTRLDYPDFDLTAPRDVGTFDVVICEQVLEHVPDPFRAAETLAALARPGGRLLVSVPFAIKIHGDPGDYWRFSPQGLTVLLERAGLVVERLERWGNRSAFSRGAYWSWAPHKPWRSLRDEWGVPIVVWAYAVKPAG